MKEVKLKCNAGPFGKILFDDDYIQSPIGLVSKDNGADTHLIFHLSYPRTGETSLNANTPKELCSVKYPDFAEAIRIIDALISKVGACFAGTSDAKLAFRNLCINKRFWHYLIMKAKSPF